MPKTLIAASAAAVATALVILVPALAQEEVQLEVIERTPDGGLVYGAPEESGIPQEPRMSAAEVTPATPAIAVGGDADCTTVDVRIPPIESPVYDVTLTIRDLSSGLARELADCNPEAEVFILAGDITAGVAIPYVSDTARVRLPTARLLTVLVDWIARDLDWEGERFWNSDGPVMGRTSITLMPGPQFGLNDFVVP